MMKMKRWLAACLAALLALSCCACAAGPETAAQALEKMQAALDGSPCGHAQLLMDMAVTLDAGEAGTLAMSSKITSDITVSREPVSGCTTAVTELDYGGEKSRTVTENYTVMEEGEAVSYLHSSGVWMRLASGQTPEELLRSASAVSMEATDAAIDETVTEYEGRAAICLTGRLGRETLQAVLGGLLESIGAAAENAAAVDYDALSAEARLYLDRETCLPIAQEMRFSGLSEVLSSLYAQADMRADVTVCTATARFLSYEPQEEIVLPEGAKEKAERWTRLLSGEPDNGDGSFTIREGSALIDITAPEGFALSEKDYDHVCFRRDDQREIRYTAVHGTTEYLRSKVDQQLARYGDLPEKVSRQQMTLAGDTLCFEADIVGVEWQSYEEGRMYGWAELSRDGDAGYYLFVEVVDGYNDGLGGSKSADVTPEEFMAYLNGAVPSDLMEE